MNKKKKNRGGKKTEKTTKVLANPHMSAFEEALSACSLERLWEFYASVTQLELLKLKGVTDLVTRAEIDSNNATTARAKMIRQLKAHSIIGPMKGHYQRMTKKELRSMGGMKVTFVGGKKSFAYTCGFTDIGGRELAVRNIHSSMFHSGIKEMFNHLFKRHKEGHPVGFNHTIEAGSTAYVVNMPDPHEATLMKVDQMFEPTRFYGIAKYDILILELVGVNNKVPMEGNRRLSREEVLQLAHGNNTKIKDFQSLGGKTRKLEACARCNVVHDTTRTKNRLFKCLGCHRTYYCCREHQVEDWPRHKAECKKWKNSKKHTYKSMMDEILEKLAESNI